MHAAALFFREVVLLMLQLFLCMFNSTDENRNVKSSQARKFNQSEEYQHKNFARSI